MFLWEWVVHLCLKLLTFSDERGEGEPLLETEKRKTL